MTLDLLLCALAMGVALALRPWRALPAGGPPWPWLAWWAVLPALWGADRLFNLALLQPQSGACLLVLMAGWPLAMLGLLGTALLTAALASLDAAEALHRLAWLGVLPGTCAMLLGAAVRRWLPHHLFVYILGRGFFVTLLAGTLAGAGALLLHGGVPVLGDGELMLGRWLAAWGDAFITGMWVAIFVAFRPQWLATYTDRLYLPPSAPPLR